MIPSSALASRLYCLAFDMRSVAALMRSEGERETVPPADGFLLMSHAAELEGAADIAGQWASEVGADHGSVA